MTTTQEKWSTRVTAWRASGETAPRFCSGKGFSASGLRYWASRLERREAESGVRIARVVRGAAPPEQAESPIVVEAGGMRVAVRRGFDAEALRAVLAVIGGGQ
jgi:hypothetical protein